MALENFVAMEVMKHLEWARTDAGLFHYRTGNEEIAAGFSVRRESIRFNEIRLMKILCASSGPCALSGEESPGSRGRLPGS